MGKLGKKARKFAKKNLQSVHKMQRKNKVVFKKRLSSSSKGHKGAAGDPAVNATAPLEKRDLQGEEFENVSLDDLFSDESDMADDASDSDGYLSEDLSGSHVAEKQNAFSPEDSSNSVGVSVHNIKVQEELTLNKKKLNKLIEKDPEFTAFLANYEQVSGTFEDEEMDSDEDTKVYQITHEDSFDMKKGKVLNKSLVDSWYQLAKEEYSESALTSLLNGYRAACHYDNNDSQLIINNRDIFSSILIFMLHEADNIFRHLLKIPSSISNKEVVLEKKNTPKWKAMKPLIKSYLRSTLFLLNQITDTETLVFALGRLRASLIFFVAFPYLLRRLIKVAVHFWASGEGTLASSSFVIIRDVAIVFSTEFFDICFIKTYKAYIAYSTVTNSREYFNHIEFLGSSLVELCSLDVHRSSAKAVLSIERLTNIFKQGLKTKKKESLKKICSSQYANCINLWVKFLAANTHDYDLHELSYVIIQLIYGVACLFPGPRYFPLRLKCIQWLSSLSKSSRIFVSIASLVLDVLEYKIGKVGGKSKTNICYSSVMKLPKYWLKSQNFQEECISSAIELLCCHFAQWSYHISFPELATFPLIRLKKFHEIATVEGSKRLVKRFIDQVEQNVEFVQKKRDEMNFSPKDHTLVESFLQLEKGSPNTPFTQYYRSVIEKAALRDLSPRARQSSLELKEKKRKRGNI